MLGIDPFDVRCVTGDTGMTPVDLGSYSSRVTVMMGNAAIDAANKIRKLQIAEAAAEQLEVSPDKARVRGRLVFAENQSITFAQAAGFAEERFGTLGAVGSYKPPRAPGRYKGAGVGPSPAYSYTACVVEAEVDPATGWITVPSGSRTTSAGPSTRCSRAGRSRQRLHGPFRGADGRAGVPPPAAEALRRARAQDPVAPRIQEPHLARYARVDTVLVEDPDPNCPFGAKEVGQGPLLPVMPAVANAIYDAVGVRIDELPITPDKVLRALEKKNKGEPARVGRSVSRPCRIRAGRRAAAVGRR